MERDPPAVAASRRRAAGLLLFCILLLSPPVRAQVDVARARLQPLMQLAADRRGIPFALVDAVVMVESNYDPAAVGASGEIGLMQVLPGTAQGLGFRGTLAQLAEPETNLRLGVEYLAGAWTATQGRLCDTLMKYRAGYGTTTMSVRSVLYCRRARGYLALLGSPLAAGPGAEIPPITPEMEAAEAAAPVPGLAVVTPAELGRLRRGRRTSEDSQRFWMREEARIRLLHGRIEARLRSLHARKVSFRVSAIVTDEASPACGAHPTRCQ